MKTVTIGTKERVVFSCPPDLREEIATWRAQQRPIPSESRAVVVLIRAALEAWRKEQPTQRRRLKGQP
jgi:hypothetical protein